MASFLHRIPVLLAIALLSTGPARAQIQALPMADAADPSFGVAVALGEGRALVGASGEDVCGDNSGAVYVFEKDDAGVWRRTTRLTPSDCEAGAFFGRSLALSGDRALIGASKEFFADERPNVAYVFERDTATGRWRETSRLTVNPQHTEGTFAASVALDGQRALVTARGQLPSPVRDASTRGASSTGAAFLFEQHPRTNRWQRVARLAPRNPDPRRAFGGACALDGDRLAVTASPYFAAHAGAVYIFEKRPSNPTASWVQTTRLEGFDDFSVPVALAGHRLLVGESRAGGDRSGGAVLFERAASGVWVEATRLRPRTPYRDGAFGTAVSLSSSHALVTGYDEQLGLGFNIDRVVYVFERYGTDWRQRQLIDMGAVSFGTAIDHHGSEALVGHASEDGPGAAYIIGLQ